MSTIVPRATEAELTTYHDLCAKIASCMPRMAKVSSVLQEHLPLLKEMQALLSHRPKEHDLGEKLFTKIGNGRVLAREITVLPTWSHWLAEYAAGIDYSVRHIQRLIFDEPKKKTIKTCGWSVTDHNRLLTIATAAIDLVNAYDAGADINRFADEIREIAESVEDVVDRSYERVRKQVPKKPAKRVS